MARQKRESDSVYNARRRYRREAQRYLAKANKSSGVERSRYLAQARESTMKAVQTYGPKQKVQGQVKKLVDQLGISSADITSLRKMQTKTNLDRLKEQSYEALAGKKSANRDDIAKEILIVGNIGSRFYGGLIDIWGDTPEHRRHPNQAIKDYFGVTSIMDVLEMLEEQGIDIYAPDINDDVYKSIQLQLQKFVLINKRMNRS